MPRAARRFQKAAPDPFGFDRAGGLISADFEKSIYLAGIRNFKTRLYFSSVRKTRKIAQASLDTHAAYWTSLIRLRSEDRTLT